MTSDLFLSHKDVVFLTDRGTKSGQAEQLRQMGIPFFVGASGWPKVAISAIEGRKQETASQPGWKPAVLQGSRKAA